MIARATDRFLLAMVLSVLTVAGCGGGGSSDKGQAEPFELDGTWVYSGADKGFAETLEFSNTSMVETDLAGKGSATWSIDEYDNEQDHARTTLRSVTAAYPYEIGQVFYASYVLRGNVLDFYYAEDQYPVASGGVESVDYWQYTKQSH